MWASSSLMLQDKQKQSLTYTAGAHWYVYSEDKFSYNCVTMECLIFANHNKLINQKCTLLRQSNSSSNQSFLLKIWEEQLFLREYIFRCQSLKFCSVSGYRRVSFRAQFTQPQIFCKLFEVFKLYITIVLLLGYKLFIWNIVSLRLFEIDFISKMGLCFFSPCCIEFTMAQ